MVNKVTLGLAGLIILLLGVFLPVGKTGQTVIERVTDNNVRALNSPFLSIGAVSLFSAGSEVFTQGTSSILCSLQAPASTSTLVKAGFKVTTPTTSVTYLSISRSATQGTVGTGVALLASTTVPANGLFGYAVASSTSQVFAPNVYLNFAQTNGGVLNQTGSCEALWLVI